jgi:hypothetical protein
MLLHPAGAEDDHEAIFTEYVTSDGWVQQKGEARQQMAAPCQRTSTGGKAGR